MKNTPQYPEKLLACWHPVAYGHEVGADQPYGAILLDEPVVLWRDAAGQALAMKDVCIHRGTALSLGWLADGCLVCPYHGWRYDENGKCILIPQRTNPNIPEKARIERFHCQERYGLVWGRIVGAGLRPAGNPRIGRRRLEDGQHRHVCLEQRCFPGRSKISPTLGIFRGCIRVFWATSTGPSSLITRSRPAATSCITRSYGQKLQNSEDFPVFGNEEVVQPQRRSRYELHLPYTIVLRLGWGGDKGMVYFFASRPISPDLCEGYCIIGRNYDLEQPDAVLQDFEDTIFNQDRRIIESQRPEQVPFDLADELHLTFDAVAVAYRRAMQAQELAYAHYLDVVYEEPATHPRGPHSGPDGDSALRSSRPSTA